MSILLLDQENKKLFRADPQSESWREYIDYIDGMVLQGFFNVVNVSLEFLSNNMQAKVSTSQTMIRIFLHVIPS